jgi:heme exporter protein C
MHKYATPAQFQKFCATVLPFLAAAMVMCSVLGLYAGLVMSPADYQQGEAVRIMYIHVPAAWLGSALYGLMALASASFLIWRHPLADIIAREAAPLGAGFTLLTLATGMLWGKPMWGAYWVWDARLTSVLVLFLLYLGYLALSANAQDERTKIACAWLALIGAINLPIIKFSVQWWNTLHQPASILRRGGPSIDGSMLMPLLLMIVAFTALAGFLLLTRAQTALLAQKLNRLQRQQFARRNAAIEH